MMRKIKVQILRTHKEPMLRLWQEYRQRKTIQAALMSLHGEIDKNLESFFVMEQLGRLRFFALNAVRRVLENNRFPLDESVKAYARTVEDYNRTLKEFQDYEQWYNTEDLSRKTKENGLALHAKKDAAQVKFKELEKFILAAKKNIEEDLSRRNIPVESQFSGRPKYAERITRTTEDPKNL